MDGIAAVGTARVVEVDGIEGRYFLIALLMAEQVVVSDLREVGKFVVVDILGISFFDLLFDKLIYNGVAFAGTGRTQYDGRAERIYDIDPAAVSTFVIVEARGQIYRIVVSKQARFLHETFVFVVENIVHQTVFQKARHPHPAHQKADISG